ncbi:type II toxin-antitoxin system Phd/YefM family antitoxin [Tomitella fengzijianii]|uniref:Antitoxin n=1 Tax=Tomitella fengzijianii TaxID=2597660 RepID=A0A516X230_9ACTN|nr:type II toxin-antitoxin system Phd/YefM family antitoxin [Tomitella fengzijianii]QDQ97144.1 type II toxin-antitoxin system Phd/YefM family antitoxin [Tomitella fengzijianii]
MKAISSTKAKARLNALLAEVEMTGRPVMITSRGRPVAVLSPAAERSRTFGALSGMKIPARFDDPLTDAELAQWEGAAG